MTLQDLLNADISAVAQWARQGFDWWVGELAQMVPERWRRGALAERPVVELGEGDEPARIWRRARCTETAPQEGLRPQVADIGLCAKLVLTRNTVLPALGMADLRRLVALDLDRLTPFRSDQVYFDLELLARDELAGRQPVLLAVIPRADAEAALERARLYAIRPRRMGIRTDAGLAFDFMPSIRAAGRGGRPDRRLAWWWLGAAALIALNVGVLSVRDMDDVAALRAEVDLRRPTVALAQRLRQMVERESAFETAVLARRARNEPLRIIDAVTGAFPSPQWVQRLEWNGRSARIVGSGKPDFDVLGAVRGSQVLGSPRALNTAGGTSDAAKKTFDVIAEQSGGGRP